MTNYEPDAAHYREVVRKFRVAVELDGVPVETALASATVSGIGLAQIADLREQVAKRYPTQEGSKCKAAPPMDGPAFINFLCGKL